MTQSRLIQPPKLSHVDWPGDAVFVVDDALPERLVQPLPEPVIAVRAGESLKSLASIEELAAAVLEYRSSRPLTLVGIGGGAIGDAVGFLASTLWRGVALWHVPTTLVAMVDSAHGGKTAVNLKRHKNQLGTFFPADTVVTCLEFLDTLPLALRRQGLVELIKALWLARPDALSSVDNSKCYNDLLAGDIGARRPLWSELLETAIDAKNEVVAADPREQTGHRRILNLGHTAGHGLETLYELSHGDAVAWGLAACALLSHERAGLSAADCDRLLKHVDPLCPPLPHSAAGHERDRFIAHLQRDKKRVDGQLISILLDAPGQPVQTSDITPEDWWDAVACAHHRWRTTPITIRAPESAQSPNVQLPADKSRANRAAAIAYLRGGATDIEQPDTETGDDVAQLRRALRHLDDADNCASRPIHTGNGGTTTRFLTAIAACRPETTALRFGSDVDERPHRPLWNALRGGGANIERHPEGIEITGWSVFPDQLRVDPSSSSQFASALALLSASGHPFRLHVTAPLTSRPYFELTCSMLVDAGVDVENVAANIVQFSPTPQLERAHRIRVPGDISSAVVWQALQSVRGDIDAPSLPDVDHPDRRFADLARRLVESGDSLTVDLGRSPDLAPVLAAMGCLVESALTVTGAAHLRHKESNRIDDLAESFGDIGLEIAVRSDGFAVPAGVQSPRSRATFDPRGDHRLAMAAAVLSTATESLEISQARCVAKSYPDLWHHLRNAGFQIAAHR